MSKTEIYSCDFPNCEEKSRSPMKRDTLTRVVREILLEKDMTDNKKGVFEICEKHHSMIEDGLKNLVVILGQEEGVALADTEELISLIFASAIHTVEAGKEHQAENILPGEMKEQIEHHKESVREYGMDYFEQIGKEGWK